MKKTFLTVFLSLVLSFAILFNLTSCSTNVLAHSLMDGIEKNQVHGKDADEKFILSQLKFSLDLVKEGHKEGGNTLLSPLSIALALAMTANGADGKTLSQMEAVLGDGLVISDLNEYLYRFSQRLASEGSDFKLANSVWFRDSFQVSKSFLQTNADYYGAEAYQSAFDETALQDMNNWVEKNTDGMIKKALDSIDPATVMYLINTLMFEGEWEEKYEKDQLFDSVFHSADGAEQEVKMMCSEEITYLKDKHATGFIKPYKGGHFSFAAILPNEGLTPEEYLKKITAEELLSLLQNPSKTDVTATMPEFSLEYSASLAKVLENLGMADLFGSEADLGRMTEEEADLAVSDVIHKAYISVDEKGTKAGAATIIDVKKMSLEKSETVTLDRPFLYMILDNTTSLPIFFGIANSI